MDIKKHEAKELLYGILDNSIKRTINTLIRCNATKEEVLDVVLAPVERIQQEIKALPDGIREPVLKAVDIKGMEDIIAHYEGAKVALEEFYKSEVCSHCSGCKKNGRNH